MTAFSVTTPSATVALPENRTGEVAFTITNTSGRQLRARARPVALDGGPPEWLTVVGDAERDFEPGAAHQFTVRVEPPLGAAAGRYAFRVDAVGVERPDDDYAQGPSCSVEVPAPTARITAPRGYLATLTGATLGGVIGEGIIVATFLTSDREDPACEGLGCAVGEAIGEAIVLVFALLFGFVLLWIGASIGTAIALRVRRYLGAKLTAGFLALLLLPWAFLMGVTVMPLITDLTLLAVLAPVLLVCVPALLARAAVLLIRTRHI